MNFWDEDKQGFYYLLEIEQVAVVIFWKILVSLVSEELT